MPMLYDHRIYTCKPGTLVKQLELYEKFGKAPQTKHLGQPLFYAITETGLVNSYIHIWSYENAGDRESRRAAMEADPDWQDFKLRSAEAGNLIRQENQLMTSVGFFPAKR